ncbi:MAG: rod shape-determining protein MreC [Ketobacteraceae bacterium]|nr:rod shape-determining protein MreC [Ketobacteraceae bacterium]
MFAQNTANRYRLVFFTMVSFALIFVDHRTDMLNPVRNGLSVFTLPIHYVANIPHTLVEWSSESVQSREDLEQENRRLESEVLLLQRRVQKLAAIVAENTRLKELLNSADLVDDQVIVAEIVGVDPDPFRHEVIIDKGSRDKAYPGQAVLDADGLMGQLTDVGPFSSRALLISDASHGVPVHVARNGVRAIAVGSGSLDKLKLIHVPDTADIVVGDLLVTSGLGGRFPSGYPVGKVTEVRHDPGLPFAIVSAVPLAQLDRSRHVLLVFSEENRIPPVAAGEIDNAPGVTGAEGTETATSTEDQATESAGEAP